MQALTAQYQLLGSLIDRNVQLRDAGEHRDDEAVIPLPFVLLQTGARTFIDVQISKNEHDALIDFGRYARRYSQS